MKKLILITVSILGFTFGAIAETAPATAPNTPAANGPKRATRQEMRKKIHEENKEKIAAVQAKVKEACAPDIATAGCTGKEGGELMKCVRTYKEAHPDFKRSDACKEAMGEGREARHEMREEMHDKMGQMRHHHGDHSEMSTSGTSTTTTGH